MRRATTTSRLAGVTSAWEGRLVRLRAVEPGDWEAFIAFDQYSDDTRAAWFLPPPQSAERLRREVAEWSSAEQGPDEFRLVIEALAGNTVTGTINTHDVDQTNVTFQYGVSIGRPYQRRGYASEAVVLVMRFMFAERRFTKCNVEVFASNTGSAALHERLGFVREGCRRRSRYAAGRFEDVILFGMTIDEFAGRYGLTAPDVAP